MIGLGLVRVGLVRVTGRSMEPTLREGDLLLVARGIRPRVGSLAVCRLPPDDSGASRPLAVKRVTGHDPADPTRWWVERDNPREGVDSWLVGSLASADIRAVVLARLPRARRPARLGGLARPARLWRGPRPPRLWRAPRHPRLRRWTGPRRWRRRGGVS